MELDQLKRMGEGNTAEIFMWEEGKILKLFRKGLPQEIIEQEYSNCLTVMEYIPCVPRTYEQIQVEERSGIVYEYVQGKDMLKVLVGSVFKIKYYSRKLAHFHKMIHVPVEKQMLTVKDKLRYDIENQTSLTEEIKIQTLEYLDKLPEGDSLCHFDFHPGNIILCEDKPIILDWMTACKGNKLADVARTSLMLKYGQVPHAPWAVRKLIAGMQKRINKIYRKEYEMIASCQSVDIDQWELPLAAARLREWIPESEKAILVNLVESHLKSLSK